MHTNPAPCKDVALIPMTALGAEQILFDPWTKQFAGYAIPNPDSLPNLSTLGKTGIPKTQDYVDLAIIIYAALKACPAKRKLAIRADLFGEKGWDPKICAYVMRLNWTYLPTECTSRELILYTRPIALRWLFGGKFKKQMAAAFMLPTSMGLLTHFANLHQPIVNMPSTALTIMVALITLIVVVSRQIEQITKFDKIDHIESALRDSTNTNAFLPGLPHTIFDACRKTLLELQARDNAASAGTHENGNLNEPTQTTKRSRTHPSPKFEGMAAHSTPPRPRSAFSDTESDSDTPKL